MTSRAIVIVDQPDAPHIPTAESREMVSKAVACGASVPAIAYMLGIPPLEVKRAYADELEFGQEVWTTVLGSKLIDVGRHGDVNAARFFLQARGRWAVPTRAEGDKLPDEQTDQQRKQLMDSVLGMVQRKEEVPSAQNK